MELHAAESLDLIIVQKGRKEYGRETERGEKEGRQRKRGRVTVTEGGGGEEGRLRAWERERVGRREGEFDMLMDFLLRLLAFVKCTL